jgi:hypothetical protein
MATYDYPSTVARRSSAAAERSWNASERSRIHAALREQALVPRRGFRSSRHRRPRPGGSWIGAIRRCPRPRSIKPVLAPPCRQSLSAQRSHATYARGCGGAGLHATVVGGRIHRSQSVSAAGVRGSETQSVGLRRLARVACNPPGTRVATSETRMEPSMQPCNPGTAKRSVCPADNSGCGDPSARGSRPATTSPRNPHSRPETRRNTPFLEHRQGLPTQASSSTRQPDRTRQPGPLPTSLSSDADPGLARSFREL